jgi:predicted nuclease of restriction endonuclease-like RecB superfamily
VLGHPALDADARAARIRGAARELEVTVERLEAMLWSDLPSERPVELRFGRPAELEVAAFANVTLIQRSLRRAHAAVLRVWGDAGALLRAARRCGLLVTASTGRDGEIELELVGPLALCHRTSVYGRALGSLVPLLAEYDRFELELHAHTRTGSYAATLASPVLLPTAPVHLVAPHQSIARLARDLARLDPELVVTPAPPALPSGDALSCPDLIVERGGRRYCVELVGFWTAAFLARKLDAYAAAGDAEVVLCLDDERAVGDEEPPEGVLRYQRRLTAAALLAALAEERGVRTATEPT